MMPTRGQGSFEYILLIGGAILVTTFSLVVLLNSQPNVAAQKQCVLAAHQDLSCFFANGTFRNDSTFQFQNRTTPCNCTLTLVPAGFNKGGTPTPSATPSVSPTPSASASPTPSATPIPSICQNTPTSCGQAGACQDCTQAQAPAPTSSAPRCNGNTVVHDQTVSVPACQNNACGFTPSTTTVTDQTCAASQICQNAQCVSSNDVALIVSDSSPLLEHQLGLSFQGTLSPKEQALEGMLITRHRGVTRVHAADVSLDTLKKYATIAATDYYPALSTDLVNQLTASGKNVMLWHAAINSMGTASSESGGSIGLYNQVGVTALDKYDRNGCSGYATIQDPQQASYYYRSSTPSGWSLAGENNCNWRWSYFTLDSGTARGVQFGYDPSALNDEGKIMADQLIRWIVKDDSYDWTVPNGRVALISQTIDGSRLTSEEQAAANFFKTHFNQDAFVVPQKFRFSTDYSKAQTVLAVHSPGIALSSFFNQLSSGTPLLLLYESIRLIKNNVGNEPGGTIGLWGDTGTAQPLTNYDLNGCNPYITIQDQNADYYYRSDVPDSWTRTAERTCNWRYDTFTKTTGSTRSIQFGYKPTALNNEGHIMLDEMIRWMEQNTTMKPVPQDQWVLVARDYSDVPSLTAEEKSAKDHLESLGQKVTVIPQTLRFKTDYANAKAVIIADSPGFQLSNYYSDLAGRKSTLILYEGMRTAQNDVANEAGGTIGLWGDVGTAQPLTNYDVNGCNPYITIQDQNADYYYRSEGINGWTRTGERYCNWRYSFFTKTTPTANSTQFGYNPANFTPEGNIMFEQLVRWMTNNHSLSPTPKGNWELIAQDYASTPTLTTEEQAAKTLLENQGYHINIIPQSRRFTTDFTNSLAVLSVNSPGFAMSGFFNGLSAQKTTLFLYDGMRLIANDLGNEPGGTIGLWGDTGTAQPLTNYDLNGCNPYITIQDQNADYYYRSNIPSSWTRTAERTCNWRYDTFTKTTGSTRSIQFGYKPTALNNEGHIMLDEMIRWMTGNTNFEKSITAGNAALLIQNYTDATVLTPSETAAKANLEAEGLIVDVVPQNLRFKTDFSQAAAVVLAEYPGFTLSGYFTALRPQIPRAVLLGRGLGIRQNLSPRDGQTGIYVQRSESFLQGYPTSTTVGLTDNPVTAETYGGDVSGWTMVAETASLNWGHNLFYAQPTSSQCLATMGFHPEDLNGHGQRLLDNVMGWMYQSCYLANSGTIQTVEYKAYCESPSKTGDRFHPYTCGSGTCDGSTTIEIPRSVHRWVYRTEFVDYMMDDFGAASINGANLVNKNACCNNDNTCSGGSSQQGECKGGCTWTGTTWTCGFIDGSRNCAVPGTQLTTALMSTGTNTLNVHAIDMIYGKPIGIIGSATMRTYQRSG